jgi:hypothetical protein
MYARANTPNFLQMALDTTACAPFFKERRMKLVEPTGANRKFGAMGHPSVPSARFSRPEPLAT